MKKAISGMTLIEATVSMAAMGVLATLSLGLLQYSSLALTRSEAKKELNGQSVAIVKRLRQDFFTFGARYRQLDRDNISALHRSANDSTDTFRTDSEGYPAWQEWVGYSLSQDILYRHRFPISDSSILEPPRGPRSKQSVIGRSISRAEWSEIDSRRLKLQLRQNEGRRTLEYDLVLTAGQGDAL